MSKRRRGLSRMASFALYQVAGELVLAPDLLTEGQRARLGVLLLDVLSDPERFKGAIVADLHRLAKKP